MPVRSRRLGSIRTVPLSAFTNVFTVAAGRTAIVRRWSIVNRTAAAREVRLGVRSGSQTTEVARAQSLAAFAALTESDTNLILTAGEELVVWNGGPDTDTAVHVHASGSLLEGDPE